MHLFVALLILAPCAISCLALAVPPPPPTSEVIRAKLARRLDKLLRENHKLPPAEQIEALLHLAQAAAILFEWDTAPPPED